MEQLDLTQLLALLFVVIALIVLIVIILIVYIISARRGKKEASEAEGEAKAGTQSPPARLVEAERLLSMVREEKGGPMLVEIGGARYRRLAEVEEPDIRRRIVAAAMELIHFTGVLGEGPLEPAPIEKTRSWREDMRQGSQIELQRAKSTPLPSDSRLRPPPAPEEIEERFLDMLAEMGASLPKIERTSMVSSIQHRLQPKPTEPATPRTFVDDIDDIVQRRIRLIPAMAGRELHVRPGAGGVVRFAFEGQEYGSVDDIPNLTARQLIKDAIQEWDETT